MRFSLHGARFQGISETLNRVEGERAEVRGFGRGSNSYLLPCSGTLVVSGQMRPGNSVLDQYGDIGVSDSSCGDLSYFQSAVI